jgi:hypothetical protein
MMADTLSKPPNQAESTLPTKLRAVWLSYDLGVKGDYEGLYVWLDDHKAQECGDSLAYFQYAYTTDPMAELAEELKKSIAMTNATRLYAMIFDPETQKTRGQFLVGSRRIAPWVGRGTSHLESQSDEG